MKTNDDSTFDRLNKNTKFKKAFAKEREELFLSELVAALMEEDNKTVRALAEEANISPTIIQKLRTGKQTDVKISNFMKILKIFGYHIEIVKKSKRIVLPLGV